MKRSAIMSHESRYGMIASQSVVFSKRRPSECLQSLFHILKLANVTASFLGAILKKEIEPARIGAGVFHVNWTGMKRKARPIHFPAASLASTLNSVIGNGTGIRTSSFAGRLLKRRARRRRQRRRRQSLWNAGWPLWNFWRWKRRCGRCGRCSFATTRAAPWSAGSR